MTAANEFSPLPFTLKQEKNENEEEEDEDSEDAESVCSLAQPTLVEMDSFLQASPADEFLRLTSMVRRVYFSYLHKSVISNYNLCYNPKGKEISKAELKKVAGQMELCAVKASLEATVYRKTMLEMISDIKESTSCKKTHKKLRVYLERPPTRSDAAVQTQPTEEQDLSKIFGSHRDSKDVNIQSAFVTSNFDENSQRTEERTEKNLDDRISELLKKEKRASPVEAERKVKANLSDEKNRQRSSRRREKARISLTKKSTKTGEKKSQKLHRTENTGITQENKDETQENVLSKEISDIFDSNTKSPSSLTKRPEKETKLEDEGSQDSLMQHLEDMFCESDDSSDLMTLIEKHSGVTKANIDSEIGKMCPIEEETPKISVRTVCPPRKPFPDKNAAGTENPGENTGNKRKLSFTSYKIMKKRAMAGETEETATNEPEIGLAEDKESRRTRGIWFVERVHRVSKLRAKMLELSVMNYRKHGRVRAKFIELFGDSDEEEMMPESPIRIEEHLTACKDRIAPWVVKYLMPYYSKRVIRTRLLFKTLAKHIADMLIIENTFPEENCVDNYVKEYFRSKTCIKIESDIYI